MTDLGLRASGFDSAALNRWISLYDLEHYLFRRVSAQFKERHTLEPYDFYAIVVWKSNRAKTKVKNGLLAARKSVNELMKEVSQADTHADKVDILVEVDGIGLAIASAILAVCYSDYFTVLDYRAWQTLQSLSVDELPTRYPWQPQEYLAYCQVCRALAQKRGISLRDLDRALWARSWEQDLLKLIGD